jgi:hypothetical protein
MRHRSYKLTVSYRLTGKDIPGIRPQEGRAAAGGRTGEGDQEAGEVETWVWNFEERIVRKNGGGKYAGWQPDQIVLNCRAPQLATNALPSAAGVFALEDGTQHIQWDEPIFHGNYTPEQEPSSNDPPFSHELNGPTRQENTFDTPTSHRIDNWGATTDFWDTRWPHMPPVIGSYARYTNCTVKYNPIPAGLNAIRHKLFKLEKPVLLRSQHIADYWPYEQLLDPEGASKYED